MLAKQSDWWIWIRLVQIADEINYFEQQYSIYKAESPKQSNSFSIFQGCPEANSAQNTALNKSPNSSSNAPPNGGNRQRRSGSLCRGEHRFAACPYVNPAVQPAGWTPDPAIQTRFEQPKHPKMQDALDFAPRDVANNAICNH